MLMVACRKLRSVEACERRRKRWAGPEECSEQTSDALTWRVQCEARLLRPLQLALLGLEQRPLACPRLAQRLAGAAGARVGAQRRRQRVEELADVQAIEQAGGRRERDWPVPPARDGRLTGEFDTHRIATSRQFGRRRESGLCRVPFEVEVLDRVRAIYDRRLKGLARYGRRIRRLGDRLAGWDSRSVRRSDDRPPPAQSGVHAENRRLRGTDAGSCRAVDDGGREDADHIYI